MFVEVCGLFFFAFRFLQLNESFFFIFYWEKLLARKTIFYLDFFPYLLRRNSTLRHIFFKLLLLQRHKPFFFHFWRGNHVYCKKWLWITFTVLEVTMILWSQNIQWFGFSFIVNTPLYSVSSEKKQIQDV